LLAWQQPIGHELGPQLCGSLQMPITQVSVAPQVWQLCPLWPQLSLVVPPLQMVPSQQPRQLAAEQLPPLLQLPPTHPSVAPHFLQA